MNQNLLIVGAGIETIPAILEAQKMGIYVIVTDKNPNAPGIQYANDFLIACTYDVNASVAKSKIYHNNKRHIDGVICIASDVPYTVAKVAESLRIPGISPETALLVSNKYLMKTHFQKNNIATPRFKIIKNITEFRSQIASNKMPMVLKPVDSRGSRGVLLLDSSTNLDWAYKHAKSYSSNGDILLERFMPGPQISVESIIVDGVSYTIGYSDRNYEFLERFSPFIIENGGELPSFIDDVTKKNIEEVQNEVAKSFNIRNGVLKADVVLNENRPYLIEVAGRLSGGYFCSHEIPLNTGVNFIRQAIRLALGMTINLSELKPRFNRPVAQRYIFANPGKVIDIIIQTDRTQDNNIALLEIRVSVGDVLPITEHHSCRAGVVICTGNTKKNAIALAEKVVKSIKIKTIK